MREFGFRHLPVVDGKDLKGVVSLRDVLMHQSAELQREARRAYNEDCVGADVVIPRANRV